MIKISKERKEAYVEVLEILRHMDKKYLEKIPKKLVEFFEDNSSIEYKFVLETPIEKMELKKETLNLLAMININYWCEDEEHKNQLITKYHQNEIKLQQEFLEKYHYDNLFKRKNISIQQKQETEEESVSLMKCEDSIFKKIINIIKKAIYLFR